ncbi:MAG: T9SS type A sorting domain-containing protein [Candidatus Marinimicrobia bacterium]|nr:T9SS type A sorting domain-containing protein [Candidatus Neomarinimicrobiota bacterium]
MKKIIVTLLLIVLISTQVFAEETGTVMLYYNNGTVSYTDTQTFYEFDVDVYIDGGTDNSFREGQIYVEYNSTVFGDSVVTNNKLISVTLMGPLAAYSGALYNFPNNGADASPNSFSITFEPSQTFSTGFYDSNTYISNASGTLSTIMRIKLEVIASGSSEINWPDSVDGINNLFREYSSELGDVYEGFSPTNATETTNITYSNTGDPALPITLKEFVASYEESKVKLNWITESEVQNLGYIIKRAIMYADDDISAYEVIASYQENDNLYGAGTTTEQNIYFYYDKNVKPGVNYSYILVDVDYDGNAVEHGPVSIIIPENLLYVSEDFKLGSTYPNPFNPSFTIPFELTHTMDVSINMYDITGRQVMSILDGTFDARQYQIRVNASNFNSGIYFVRTIIGNEVITQKITLLK